MQALKALLFVFALLLGMIGSANAVGPDFTPLTSAIDVTTVGAAILTVAAIKIGPKVYRWAAGMISALFGRG